MTVRTGAAAVTWCAAQSHHRSRNWSGLCLMFSRLAFNVPAKYPRAIDAWIRTTYRHPATNFPPAGVPIWWSTGSGRPGHVAVSAGGGLCWSTDARRSGWPDLVSIAGLTRAWGMQHLGWSEDINGVRVYNHVITPAPRILHLANLKMGLTNPDVMTYQRALRAKGDLARWNPSGPTGYYGIETAGMTTHAYRDYLHLTGGDTRVPGPTLLKWLGYQGV